jgi:hypothetical protein
MLCPLCRQRQARRRCPALGREICAICCGTKRLVEVACPADCAYLARAQAHPAAAVRKQQQRDYAFLEVLTARLSSAQQPLALVLLGVVTRFGADPLLRLQDEDVADMAASLASTLETASRGVIYEHRPRSLVAQRLTSDIRATLEQLAAEGGRRLDGDAVEVLKRFAAAFREAPKVLEERIPTVGLAAAGRLLRALGREGAADQSAGRRIEQPGPTLIRP